MEREFVGVEGGEDDLEEHKNGRDVIKRKSRQNRREPVVGTLVDRRPNEAPDALTARSSKDGAVETVN